MNALAAAYAHGPGRVIAVGPRPWPDPVPGERIPLRSLTGFGAVVARLLVDVMSPLRWEPWNQYNDHRAYPSPRSAYLVDVLVDGWVLDPVRRALVGGVPSFSDLVRLELVTRRERLSSGYGEFGDALAELEAGHVLGALVSHARRLGLSACGDTSGVTLRPGDVRAAPVVLRTSGLGPRGLSADPRPLPFGAFQAFVAAIGEVPGLRQRLAVHNVSGVPDGWYGVAECDAMGALQRTFGHPPSTIHVDGMNLGLVVTADVGAAVLADGPLAYRDLLRAAGTQAQSLCEAAASAGMFCRPVRSVDDPALEAAAGAPLSHSLLYVLLAGRQRIRCFPYDLTPLEPM